MKPVYVPSTFAVQPFHKGSRKYDYLYVLQGNYGYGHGWEDLTAAPKTPEGRKEIKGSLKEYREKEGGSYRIISRRELKA